MRRPIVRPALGAAGVLGGLLRARGRRRRASLAGRCALVAGGSRGLGLEIARVLARRGARLVLAARDEDELAAARRDLAARGAEVLALRCDFSRPEEVARLVGTAERRFGAVDVLVNVAGIIQVAAVALGREDLEEVMAVNFWGEVNAIRAVLPRMRERGFGRIVNVTSIGGVVAVPHLLGYCASKFAAVGFSTGLAAEVAPDGVLVTTIVPGLVRTGSFLHALVRGQREREATLFSVAATLPLVTIDARRAARRVVLACERGERVVTLGLPAKALRLANGLAPGLVAAALAGVARLLPGPARREEGPATEAWRHLRGPAGEAAAAAGRAAADRARERTALH